MFPNLFSSYRISFLGIYIFVLAISLPILQTKLISKPSASNPSLSKTNSVKKKSSQADSLYKGKLNQKECILLYEHQLHLASQENFPFHPALKSVRKYLMRKSTRHRQIKFCQGHVNRQEYQCQMDSSSFLVLLQCQNKTYSPKKKSLLRWVDTLNSASAPAKFNSQSCRKSYFHILSLVSKSASFRKRRDQKQLKRQWSSRIAIRSFQKKCSKNFQEENFKCIFDSKVIEEVSSCMLSIPE